VHGVVAHVRAVIRARGIGRRVADRADADVARRGEILVEVRRRDLQHVGDVVEAVARGVRGQHGARVDFNAEQIPNGSGVLGAIEPMHGLATGRGSSLCRGRVEIALERRDERVDVGRARARLARRRHQMPAQLAHDLLPCLRLRRDVGGPRVLE
jgi:nucleoside-diphosphate-sugar epimerase